MAWFLLLWSCHWGRPPNNPLNFYPIVSQVHTFEPSIQGVLEDEFRQALAKRGGLGRSEPVSVELLSSQEEMVFFGGREQQWELRIRLQISRVDEEKTVVIEGVERYSTWEDQSLASADSRRQAYHRLLAYLSQDAAVWLLYAPEPNDGH